MRLLPLVTANARRSFSPVAGIQWVETPDDKKSPSTRSRASFSPVAGIQWVETADISADSVVEIDVSVPLPGFSGLRHDEGL